MPADHIDDRSVGYRHIHGLRGDLALERRYQLGDDLSGIGLLGNDVFGRSPALPFVFGRDIGQSLLIGVGVHRA